MGNQSKNNKSGVLILGSLFLYAGLSYFIYQLFIKEGPAVWDNIFFAVVALMCGVATLFINYMCNDTDPLKKEKYPSLSE